MTVRRSPRGTAATARTSHRRSLGRVSRPERESLALVVHDPDAPSGDFTHWIAWNIDPEPGRPRRRAPRRPARASTARRDRLQGSLPAPGHGAHRYFHQLYALDTELELDAGADGAAQGGDRRARARRCRAGRDLRARATRPLYLGAAAKSPRLMRGGRSWPRSDGEAARAPSRRAGSASRSCRPCPPWRGSSARWSRGSSPPRRPSRRPPRRSRCGGRRSGPRSRCAGTRA